MVAENSQPRKRGSTAKRRRGARQKAMQALYQWDFDRSAHESSHIVQQFHDLQNLDRVDVEYFEALFLYATEHITEIDAEIASHMDRPLDQLDPIERSVLRICCTELKTRLDAPYKVVVNEALEISKDFGAEKGYRYINGIADKLAAALRQTEYQRVHPDGNQLAGSSEGTISVAAAVKAKTGKVKISVKEKTQNSTSGTGSRSKASRKIASKDKAPGHDRDNNVALESGSRGTLDATTKGDTGVKVKDPSERAPDKSGRKK